MFVEHKEAGEVRELDEAGKLLLRAAAHIEKHGLSCGGGRDAYGRRCVILTIGMLASGVWDGPGDTALDRLRVLIDGGIGIATWSDNTPAERVAATLRLAALGG